MLTQHQIEYELNMRNYWKEGDDQAPPIEPPIEPPVTPPVTPSGAGLIDRFGSLALVSVGVLFLLAIFPGQSDEIGGTS
jgi:hypothetical protein